MRGSRHLRGGGARRSVRGGLAAVAAVGLLAGCPALVAVAGSGVAAAATKPVVVAARPALPSGAARVGAVAAGAVLSGDVGLVPRDPAALSTYAAAVGNPSSPLYRRYLSAGQFASLFGPAPATIDAVTAALRARGLDVTSVSSNGLVVSFRSRAATVAAAFGTHLADYRLRSGRVAYAATSAIELPADVAADVASVVGLNNLVQPGTVPVTTGGTGHARAAAPAATASGGPVACGAATADAAQYGGLTDTQIADAYGLDGLWKAGDTGAGQTIAVYELEPYSTGDIKAFDTCYFGASAAAAMIARLHPVRIDGGPQLGYGSGESELDLDDVSALAPGARIDVYEAPPTTAGYLDDFNAIVTQDAAKIATSSWYSGCETEVALEQPGLEQLENTIFEQAAVQGQTILEAAGDDGSDGCALHGSTPVPPVLSSSDPETNPYLLSVGGTTITDATTPPAEQVWNDGSFFGAGSGGPSAIWAAPAWQVAAKVPGIDDKAVLAAAAGVNGGPFCAAAECRETPDVSAQADEFTGAVTVYETPYGGWTTIGGTSSATPLWAAMLADVAATPACTTVGGLGFVPPKLYAIASVPAEYAASFNDITAGNNDVFGAADGLFPATAGYDMASGLGSPRITNPSGTPGLAYWLCATPATTVPTVTSVSPAALPVTGGTVTVTGSGFATGATPEVAAVQVGTDALPASAFSVTSPTTLSLRVPAAAVQAGTAGPTDGAGTYAVAVTLKDDQTSRPGDGSRLTLYDVAKGREIPEVDGVQVAGGSEAGGETVRVYGSGFTSGTGTPTVTFGGVAGHGVEVDSDSELTVVVPAYSASATTCATDTDPTTDVCQVEVVVRTSLGASTTLPITTEYSSTADGGLGAGETLPVATEFDYAPAPAITSIEVSGTYASEEGGSLATIDGRGFGYLDLDWVDVGPYIDASSQDFELLSITGTQLVILLPPTATITTKPVSLPVTVETEASPNQADFVGSVPPSNTVDVAYAPTPEVTSTEVLTATGAPAAYQAGPATGGTTLVVKGAGFGSGDTVQFFDTGGGPSVATSSSFTAATPTSLTLKTPGALPGIDAISVCNLYGCGPGPATGGLFTYYPVGSPTLSGVSPSSGPAGTTVTITGANLGFVQSVVFGSTPATVLANVPGLLDSGSTTSVTATVPPGFSVTVDVRVTTLESLATGTGESPVTSAATFTLKK